ncbi:hypothetical protein B5X24_HaOG213202 [Helicoverpa armigera]|uniref:Nuclear transcription factor Y subunit gamma n=1 Tax=Helicoverpa armigera TaxID=29058 RepID=A0A2W1BFA6_HELAM|nr:hypothetical protein B5X24_HaOG213202 [Helicoverpa armigera]
MSVCFFVPADQAGASGVADEVDSDIIGEDSAPVESPQQSLQQFWCKVTDDIKKVNAEDFKSQALPLARIKKIMKLDEEVKMISAEAPVLFAKAAEIFIHELTLRAWAHTEDNKRRTLQRNDIAMAITKCDQFDFLIDIVPRHEVKPNKPRYDHAPRATHTEQIQLTQAQLNMIRLQVQNNPNQPIIIQAQSQQSPQIIQVQSQAQHQPQQQVFLAQVASSQEDS